MNVESVEEVEVESSCDSCSEVCGGCREFVLRVRVQDDS
jgi:hypothetical protein